MFVFGWPQVIILALSFMGLGTHLIKHGEPKKDPRYNFGMEVIAAAIHLGLLYWGGFFS